MGVFTPRLCLAPASNDQCKQFNNANSYHQHRKRYRIVIEPMPPLHIHDAAPVLRFASAGTKSCSFFLYLCISSCSTSAARRLGRGVAAASYSALRALPMAQSQARLLAIGTARCLGGGLMADWRTTGGADTRENAETRPADCIRSAPNSVGR